MGNKVYTNNAKILLKSSRFSNVTEITNKEIVYYYTNENSYPFLQSSLENSIKSPLLYVDIKIKTNIGKYMIKLVFHLYDYFENTNSVNSTAINMKFSNLDFLTKEYIFEIYDYYNKFMKDDKLVDLFHRNVYRLF